MLTKVLIIDDHPSFVKGISSVLDSIIPSVTILTALNGSESLTLLKQQPDIDLVFLDINLPDINGIQLIHLFEQNKTTANIIVMTGDNNIGLIDQALKSHVSGFLNKDFDHHVLEDCIKSIEKGGVFLTSSHARQLGQYRDSQLREIQLIEESMSQRQTDTLNLLSKGYSNREIAELLGISESTVKTHVSCLISLFEADNRTHCVVEARRLGFID